MGMNIAVIAGGTSTERDVSLSSGKLICASLRRNGQPCTPVWHWNGKKARCWPSGLSTTPKKSTPLPRGACPTPSQAGAGTVVKENLPWWKSMPAPPKWR